MDSILLVEIVEESVEGDIMLSEGMSEVDIVKVIESTSKARGYFCYERREGQCCCCYKVPIKPVPSSLGGALEVGSCPYNEIC